MYLMLAMGISITNGLNELRKARSCVYGHGNIDADPDSAIVGGKVRVSLLSKDTSSQLR